MPPLLVAAATAAAGALATKGVDAATSGGKNNQNFSASGTPLAGLAGISNKTGVAYGQSQQGIKQQQDFVRQLQAQNGIQNQSDVYNRLIGLANGTGPNPAQDMLAQATGQNVANQAALMAGQRGASSNVGLIARQAANQGANLQQQALNQAAILQANQGMNAINSMGNLATQQVGQEQAGLNAYNQFSQNNQGQLLNSIAALNNAKVGMQSNVNSANSNIAAENAKINANMTGNVMGGIGTSLQKVLNGSESTPQNVQNVDYSGGSSNVMNAAHGGIIPSIPPSGARSFVGKHLTGSKYQYSKGGSVNGEMLAAQGKMVPGQAKVKGDSLKNDTVKAVLSPGEIVIPRSIAQGPNAPEKAAKFVAAILARAKRKR